ncbi:DUF1697 domain-containing protein [Flavobacteriaceae bacterium R38]|nr:DUF1697 domain-containing protein [Flavobacteriaceae bacterium R38]
MNSNKYIAFLRGINVGGHHKVPMADLRKTLESLGFKNVITLLNSGNIIFYTTINNTGELEKLISEHLEKNFGFSIPTIIRSAKTILELFNNAPFQDIELHKDIRLYISLLRKNTVSDLEIPWTSPDNSYHIIEKKDKDILSVLDISVTKTPKAMEVLEKAFGSDITTRNWKTIERIIKKL